MLESFTAATFQEVHGSHFRVPLEEAETIDLELVEVTGLGVPGWEGREQFSLVFRGPAEPQLAQQLWPLEHEALGRFELFLVPIGPDAEGRHRYEAVFT